MANVAPQVLQVYVLNEIVNPPNPKIPNQGMLVLINQDLNFYRVQLSNDGADDHPPIYGVLPPLGRLVLMGGPDPGDQNTQCVRGAGGRRQHSNPGLTLSQTTGPQCMPSIGGLNSLANFSG